MVAIYKTYSSPDAFWDDFSKPANGNGCVRGPRLAWSSIVHKARNIRDKADVEMEKAARAEYTLDFDEVFAYRVGGSVRVLLTPAKIAARYRALRNKPAPWDTVDTSNR